MISVVEITIEFNLEYVLIDLSFAIPSIIYLLKYSTFYIQSQKVSYYLKLIHRLSEFFLNKLNNMKQIKELNEHIRIDWNITRRS